MILLAGAANALAQTGNATLTGTVADNVGVVPGATVTATQAQTNVNRNTVTNDQGVFRIPALPPGRYVVKVEMEGFRPLTIAEFNLLGNEIRDLGRLTMTAGGVSESVTITAEVTPVQTATSQLTKNITSDTLVSVQVKGRDIFGMMKILPGIIDSKASRDYASWDSGRYLSINGGSSLNKNTTIDGVPVGEEGGNGTTHITPNIDSIGEVNIITSGYNAENGRQSSGLVSIVTKSGTNQFRGSGWYNMRRDEWNKNDFFRIQSRSPKPFFEVNIGGYSIGGPILIPGVLKRESQKKAYFFLSQEFVEDIRPTDVYRTNMPTDLERQGDFSQTFFGKATLGADGAVTGTSTLNTITDPVTLQPFAGNKIPQNRINPIGQNIINLLNPPNNQRDGTTNAYWNSNDATDVTPQHTRRNFVSRGDIVWSQNTRFSVRALFDRDDSITYNVVQPRESSSNNVFPGDLVTGSMSKVISPTVVNEFTAGYSHNHYGFRIGKGAVDQEEYLQYYRDRYPWSSSLPRIEGFNPDPGPIGFSRYNKQEWPFMPDFLFAGGNRSNLQPWRPFGGRSRLAMTWNENYRFTVQDDLSWTKGRHNFKFGFATERNSKTEPGSQDYTGVFDFGHSADNPISSGNGFANALLGVLTSYSERDNRLDRDNLHWYSAAYAQDSWRLTSRMTLDIGLRVEHHGAFYEGRKENSGFDPALFNAAQAPVLYMPACRTGVAGNQTCSSANQAAIDPRFPGVYLSRAYVGSVVPGTGSITNGMWVNGMNSHPTKADSGKKDGWYYDLPMFSWAPRAGFAWDVFGDGSTALRASGGIFYNFVAGLYPFNGGPLVTRVRTIRNVTLADLAQLAAAGTAFAESPQTTALPAGFTLPLYGQQENPGKLEPEKNYQANIAFQRDLGFNTVAEVAYVTNIGRKGRRTRTTNNIPVNAYADPKNLFNNEPITANLIRRDWRGIGSVQYLYTDEDVLNYNAMQTSVQRRLTKGLQMGLAYTLSWNRGIQGWDFMTEELGGRQGLRDFYYGPPAGNPTGVDTGVQDRRHSLVVNYSYQVPNPMPNAPVLKYVLKDWEASGVVQYLSGMALSPTCNTNQSGVANTDPSLSGVTGRCELVPGEDALNVPAWTGDPATHDAFRPHFNLNAFRRPLPSNGQGNLGNVPVGYLRHPGWQNWDFTLARRIPVTIGRGGSVRVQAQFYNMWNQVQFQRMAATYTFTQGQAGGNSSTTTGQYDQVTNPFNFGLTVRFDY
ncbi:MAG: TonB-dependent receptor [Acidobacteria bacterium]|nr:TonB-dependent receptor [Acidobacteriota bacterium]